MTTVLVADDNPHIRDWVRSILEAEGYLVLEAQNGNEVLHLLNTTSQPLLVLLDFQMPQHGGAWVLGAVAANHTLATRNRYILMTARTLSLPRFFTTLLIRLHVPVLRKPFDVDLLVALVADVARTLPAQ
jgi:CheY-like chemotaxis protein